MLSTRVLALGVAWWLVAATCFSEEFQITRLPDLPAGDGSAGIGVAGPFAGASGEALIVAGGANFPAGKPWEERADGTTPPKIYHRDVFALTLDERGEPELDAHGKPTGQRFRWTVSKTKLATPLAYGVSINTRQGVLCIGGEWQAEQDGVRKLQRSRRCFLLRWNPSTRTVEQLDELPRSGGRSMRLPALPLGVSMMGGALVGESIYLVGGDAGSGSRNQVWRCDLGARALRWKTLDASPSPARMLPATAGSGEQLFVFSGRNVQSGRATKMLADGWAWSRGGWHKTSPPPTCVMASSAISIDKDRIALFSGADGELFTRLESLSSQIEDAAPARAKALSKQKLEILNNHPGFSRDILVYDIREDAWRRKANALPVGLVTTLAVRWGDRLVIPSGEISPGIRSTAVLSVRVK